MTEIVAAIEKVGFFERYLSRIRQKHLSLADFRNPRYLRMFLGVVAAILTGSGVLGFVNTYALYYYSYRRGFRLPLEGAPHLNLTVALLSLALFLSSLLCVTLLYWITLVTSWVLGRIRDYVIASWKRRPQGRGEAAGVGQLFVTLISIALPFFLLMQSLIYGLLGETTQAYLMSHPRILKATLTLMLIVCAMAGCAVWRPESTRFLLSLVSVGLIIGILCLMFHHDTYSAFLRITRYGGGDPITLSIETDIGSTQEVRTIEGDLLLITNHTFVMQSRSDITFLEVPKDRVVMISYRENVRLYHSQH